MSPKNHRTDYAGDRPSDFVRRLAAKAGGDRRTSLELNRRIPWRRRVRKFIAAAFGI